MKPCQPFSHAGKRDGTDDARHIWPHIARAIRVLRPRFVFLENVAGHLSLGFGDVLGDLAEAGYDAQWTSLRAADVGAPHRRERVFIVATNTEGNGWPERWAEPTPRQWGHGPTVSGAALSADTEREGSQGQPISQLLGPSLIAARDRAATPNADRRASGRGYVADVLGRRTDEAEQARLGAGATPNTDSGRRAQQPQPNRNAGEQLESSQRHDAERPDTQWGAYAPAIARWEHLTGRGAPHATEPNSRGKQRLSPRFVEWLMGLPAGWVTDVPGISRTGQLHLLGNGVVPQQARAALAVIA